MLSSDYLELLGQMLPILQCVQLRERNIETGSKTLRPTNANHKATILKYQFQTTEKKILLAVSMIFRNRRINPSRSILLTR